MLPAQYLAIVKTILKSIGILAVAVGLAIPFSILAAIAAVPLMRWAEETWRIEVIGHSGPADWLLAAIWMVISAGIAITIWPKFNRSDRGDQS